MHVSLTADDVAQAQRGDARALDRLARAVLPLVRSMLKRFPLSEQDQEEVVQNSLLQVLRSLGGYRREARFTTWVYRLTVNEALMLMRKERSRRARAVDVPLEDLLDESPREADAARAADQARLRRALEALPPRYREVLLAHYADERELREIARGGGESESAVRARVHRARQLLRQQLGVEPSGTVPSSRAA